MEIDLINKCRVCLGDDKQKHYLFDEFDQGITLQTILTNTTGFKIEEDDGFSPYVCQSCTAVIVEFYNLKTIYEENENQIRALLANSEVKTDENASCGSEEVQNDSFCQQTSDVETNINADDYITIKIEPYSDNDECYMDELDSKQEDELLENDGERSNSFNENETDDSNSATNFEYREINTYTCPECGDCFLYKNDIQTHLVAKHDITKVDFDEISELSLLKIQKHKQNTTNMCKLCNQHFDTIDAYKEHIETHKKNVCDICGVGFIKKSYLKDHQEIHCPEKRHVCSYCNKAFKRRTVLVKHKRIHTHPRQCICEICGKAFNDKGTLKTHIMLLHVRERNYMCLICGVKFPLKGTLEKHIKRHQKKEREFFCTQCPLGYRDKSSLDRHIFVKHSGQNVKSTCSDCGKQYTTVSNLFKHQRNCHGMSVQPDVDENV